MTGPEKADLRLALDILRDWRKDDTSWKEDVTRRLGVLEDRFVSADAVALAETERKARRNERNQYAMWAIGAAGTVLGAVVYAVANGIFG